MITVEPEAKVFHLAGDKGWFAQTGHVVNVNEFRFLVAFTKSGMEVSESESGLLFHKVPISESMLDKTSTKEDTFNYMKEVIGPIILKKIEETKDIKKMINNRAKLIKEKLGEKPEERDIHIFIINEMVGE